jgi:hypothetical protein
MPCARSLRNLMASLLLNRPTSMDCPSEAQLGFPENGEDSHRSNVAGSKSFLHVNRPIRERILILAGRSSIREFRARSGHVLGSLTPPSPNARVASNSTGASVSRTRPPCPSRERSGHNDQLHLSLPFHRRLYIKFIGAYTSRQITLWRSNTAHNWGHVRSGAGLWPPAVSRK